MKRMMLRSMIEWLAFFGATESNGVTRILYSKERMSAQQAMKAEDGKKLIIYFDSV
jgi:allantoate deiminase